MMNVENAKRMPATGALPIAAAKVKVIIALEIIMRSIYQWPPPSARWAGAKVARS